MALEEFLVYLKQDVANIFVTFIVKNSYKNLNERLHPSLQYVITAINKIISKSWSLLVIIFCTRFLEAWILKGAAVLLMTSQS